MIRHPLISRISRRTALGGLAAGSAAMVLPQMVGAADSGPFRHGVASGDPDQASVVLWTRVTTSGDVTVAGEVAEDLGFTRIVRRMDIATGPDRDHTVKWLASGLEPGPGCSSGGPTASVTWPRSPRWKPAIPRGPSRSITCRWPRTWTMPNISPAGGARCWARPGGA